MKPLTLAEACAEAANLPGDARQAWVSSLAASMAQAVDQVEVEPFDPLLCLPEHASRCTYHGRPVVRRQRVCLAAVDPEVPAPLRLGDPPPRRWPLRGTRYQPASRDSAVVFRCKACSGL